MVDLTKLIQLPQRKTVGDDSLTQRLRSEQVTLSARMSRQAAVTAFLASIYLGWVMSADHSLAPIAIWIVLLTVISVFRSAIQARYLAAIDRDPAAPLSKLFVATMLISLAVYGLVWSAPTTVLLSPNPRTQVLVAVFLVGMSASSLGSLAPMRHAYACFVVPFLLPSGIYYLTLGDEFVNVGCGVLVYIAAMLAVGFRSTKTIEDTLRLKLENAALAARVQREKEVVELANRDLEHQIAQRERTEAELRIAKGNAEAASRAKSQFLANMSHELRTPLNGILGMSDLLLRSLSEAPGSSKHVRHTQTIRRAGERLLHLIDDILDMARVEAGALRLENTPFSPHALIGEVAELMGKQCADKQLVLSVAIAPDVPERLRGDAHRIRQILANLVANAIKFTERGGVQVELKRAAVSADHSTAAVRLRWSVTDTGIGIAANARDQLFQPFSQLDDSATRKFGGSGLGLAICQQIVSALGGEIAVESVPSQGSTFWFELSLPVEDAALLAEKTPCTTESKSMRARVLIAEDNVTNGQLVTEMLELAGCSATTVANGREALDRLHHEHFDVVLMDWHMPEMDGVTAARAWREHEHQTTGGSQRIPIIALTASVLPGDRETCLRAGMDDFVPKPFSFEELLSVILRWLPGQQAQARDS